jgi:prepilin-type N-terminal cleavage/methylation domain-containing protein
MSHCANYGDFNRSAMNCPTLATLSPRTAGFFTSPLGRDKEAAFSLIELSIVLVILGLLVGGILTGQSLIRASELRSVSVDISRFNTAILSFRDKYFALPGDMTNAVAFWGAADGAGAGMTAACATTNSTTLADPRATCNGDGDGWLDFPTQSAEPFRSFQHLTSAGLIEGRYTGIAGTFRQPGVNIPGIKVNSGGLLYIYFGPRTSNPDDFDGDYVNLFSLHGQWTGSGYLDIFKPEEAWNIDTKMDDGRPASGKVRARKPNPFTTACTTTAVNSTAEYSLTAQAIGCRMTFEAP